MTTVADYEIQGRIVVGDSTAHGVASARRNLQSVEAEAKRVGGSIMGHLGRAFAILGGATGIGYLANKLIGVNSQIQETTAGMATLLNVTQGGAMNQSLATARDLMKGLREDAAKGAGELSNYAEGIQMILGPGLNAGVPLDTLRTLNRNALGAGFALRGKEGLQLAPMDIQQALTAGAGDRTTPIVMQALRASGVAQERFNAMDPAAKIATLNTAFQKFAPGIELMGKTWSAQMSTLMDHVKELTRRVTGPLFERWSGQLEAANRWLAANEDAIGKIADTWGPKLVSLWDHLIKQAGTYAAILAAVQVAPMLGGAGGALKGAKGVLGTNILAGAVRGGVMMGSVGGGGIGAAVGQGLGGLVGALRGLGLVAARLAWPIALVSTAFLAIKGAIGEFPGVVGYFGEAWGRLMASFGLLAESFGSLSGKGSALNLVGAGLIFILGGLVDFLGLTATAISTVVTMFGALLSVLGNLMKAVYYGIRGDARGAFNSMEAAGQAFPDAWDRTSASWDKLANGAAPAAPVDWDAKAPNVDFSQTLRAMGWQEGATPNRQDININGPIKIEVRSEINEDPARVAGMISEVLQRWNSLPTQARRSMAPA